MHLLKCEFSFLRAHDDSGLETCSLLLSGSLQLTAPSCRKNGCINPWNRQSLNIWWAAACFWQFQGRPRSEDSAVAVLHPDEASTSTDGWKCSNIKKRAGCISFILVMFCVAEIKTVCSELRCVHSALRLHDFLFYFLSCFWKLNFQQTLCYFNHLHIKKSLWNQV